MPTCSILIVMEDKCCLVCNNVIICKKKSKLRHRKFCSTECAYKGRQVPKYVKLSKEKIEKKAARFTETWKKKRVYIEKTCEGCDKKFTGYGKKFTRRKCCSVVCVITSNKVRLSGKNNPSYGKTYRTKKTHPEWADKISKTSKERKINSGDKNGMKQQQAREKASISAIKKFKDKPELKEHLSKIMRDRWKDGHYNGVKVGCCKWHNFVKKNGTSIKCQGLWELEYAKYLDRNNIEFKAHVGRLSYLDEDNKERSYYPDFFLVEENKYIDVKNPYYEKIHAEKISQVRLANPSIKLEVLGYKKLMKLNIKLSGITPNRKDLQ